MAAVPSVYIDIPEWRAVREERKPYIVSIARVRAPAGRVHEGCAAGWA